MHLPSSKSFFSLTFILLGAFAVHAQQSRKVPLASDKRSGLKDSTGNSQKNHRFSFAYKGQRSSAIFNEAGTMTEYEKVINQSALPALSLNYIRKHYAGKSIMEAGKIIKSDRTIYYHIQINGQNLLFTQNGTYIKQL
jgi:hypothetical protein